MAIIPYDNMAEAEQRTTDFWDAVKGPGWKPGNVTTKLYPTRERTGDPEADADLPPGVDYAIEIDERVEKRLDPLIADNVMTALEAIPCSEFYPAWASGVSYAVGDIVTYTDGNLYVVRQAHTSQPDWQPPNVLALYMVYRDNANSLLDWIQSEAVEIGWQRTYNGNTYVCLQSHVTQPDWIPPNVPNLWQLVVVPTPDWQVGVNYQIGDHVLYNGVEYVCIQAHTSIAAWIPPNVPALWQVV